ncbi:MAG: hypothetical protein ISR65_19395 [Bacteriovoracaceae bacterium]|nr:hypothetical protein [Bacteriovoracaceae bacterium]
MSKTKKYIELFNSCSVEFPPTKLITREWSLNKNATRSIIRGSIVFLVILTGIIVYYKYSGVSNTESFVYFKKHVTPILATTCSKKDEQGEYICHGTNTIAPPTGAGTGMKLSHVAPNILSSSCETACHRASGKKSFSFALDQEGKISSDKQIMLAYKKAKKHASHGKVPFAKILRFPLSAISGGFGQYHAGGEIFDSTAADEYKILADWVKLENQEGLGSYAAISEAEKFFGKEVLPVYARNACLSPTCHIFNHSSFIPDGGMPTTDLSAPLHERFSPEQVSFNRMTSKGLIQKNIYLTGNIEESRVLKKNIPIDKGGILHRGGNNQFFSGPEDPDYQTIKKWLSLEKKATVAKLKMKGRPVKEDVVGKVQGLVFVRTKTSNYRRFLDVGKYLPGGDLFIQKLKEGETLETARSAPFNLTARFHPKSEADIREPDVRYDGRAIVFSMRVGEEDNLNVYEILLDDNLEYVEKSFRRLTYGEKEINGIKIHYTDPTYVPDSSDTGALGGGHNLEKADIVFVSNRAGNVVQSVERGTVGEADGGDHQTIIDFDRPEVDQTFVGQNIFIVDGANKGQWRKIVSFKNNLFKDEKRSYIKVDRPFPAKVDNSTIYVIEKKGSTQPGFLPSYSMYGMKYPSPGKEKFMFDETISRITYGIAQEMDLSVRTTGEVFFSCQRSFMNKYDRPIFNMASCRRHLDTRFSFPTHHGNRSQVLLYADNHELPSGIDIHTGLDPDNLWEGGNLSVSDHQLGPGLEARNPHDYATGYFDEFGTPVVEGLDLSNTKYKYKKGKRASHTRFIFKKIALFPLRGPKAVSRTGLSPGGIFRDSIPLPGGDILVSHSPYPINHFDPKANPDFDLYIIKADPSFHTEGGKDIPKVKKIHLYATSQRGVSDLQAYPIYVRMKPKINAARRAKRDHLIRPVGLADDDHRPTKYLERNFLVMDAVLDDPSPVGKNVTYKKNPISGVKTKDLDKVKYVRLVEVLPTSPDMAKKVDTTKTKNRDPVSTTYSNGVHHIKRVVAEVPLEADGSIFIKIPPKIPLIIQSLNEDKMALRQEARHYFFAPNETFTISPSPSETFQTCGACMGAMSGKPERLFGPINKFSGQAKVIAIAKAKGNPKEYGLNVKERKGVDFEKDIQPILNKRCVFCHEGENASSGLDLTAKKTHYYNTAYENLMQLEHKNSRWFAKKKYVSERNALAIESYLIAKLYGKNLKSKKMLKGDTPHPSRGLLEKLKIDGDTLSDDEKFSFVRWIDLGATYKGPSSINKSGGYKL